MRTAAEQALADFGADASALYWSDLSGDELARMDARIADIQQAAEAAKARGNRRRQAPQTAGTAGKEPETMADPHKFTVAAVEAQRPWSFPDNQTGEEKQMVSYQLQGTFAGHAQPYSIVVNRAASSPAITAGQVLDVMPAVKDGQHQTDRDTGLYRYKVQSPRRGGGGGGGFRNRRPAMARGAYLADYGDLFAKATAVIGSKFPQLSPEAACNAAIRMANCWAQAVAYGNVKTLAEESGTPAGQAAGAPAGAPAAAPPPPAAAPLAQAAPAAQAPPPAAQAPPPAAQAPAQTPPPAAAGAAPPPPPAFG